MRSMPESEYYMTQDEVAKALGVTRKYVSEVERRAMKKLRKMLIKGEVKK